MEKILQTCSTFADKKKDQTGRMVIRGLPLRIVTLLACVALASCSTTSIKPQSTPTPSLNTAQQTAPPPPPPEVNIASLPGNYGLASFQRPQDKDRTLKQAKIACRNPYKIDPGSNGGVVMHAPGQPGPAEFFIKKDAQGNSFLGPKGKAGARKDQRVVSYQEGGTLMTEWIEPRLKSVYGTMVYVRCANS